MMARSWRAVRHLSPEQLAFRAVCRGRFLLGRSFPGTFRRLIARKAAGLPAPDVTSATMLNISRLVNQAQSGLWGGQLAEIREGRFTHLGRTVDFGGLAGVKWRAEMGEGSNRLWRMTLSYFGWAVPLLQTGATRDLEVVRCMIESLEKQNPLQAPGVFRDVWHPYSASHRLINLLAGLALYAESGGELGSPDATILVNHARWCAAFVALNLEKDLQFNHLLKNLVALAVYQASLCGTSPFGFLEDAVCRSIRQNFLSDGGHSERSPMYHALAILDMRILNACGLQLPNRMIAEQLPSMLKALAIMSHTDGDIALFNDAWLGEAPVARLLGPPAVEPVGILPETGYARLAGNGDDVIFDCGACGPDSNPGHAHADFLSLENTIGGARFIVDPGVPTYSPGPLRDLCRSAAEHNGPHTSGAEPIEFWHSFRVGRRARAHWINGDALEGLAPLWVAGWHDGYRTEGIYVARWVGLWPGERLLTIDVWRGESDGRGALKFLIPASWQLSENVRLTSAARSVDCSVLHGSLSSIEKATIYTRFGEPQPAHAFAFQPTMRDDSAIAAIQWSWGGQDNISSGIEHVASVLASYSGEILLPR